MKFHQPAIGILLFRIGIGIMFLFHGWPKLIGGPEKWAAIGQNMQYAGIEFGAVFWGFMAAISEFGGGLLLISGFLFRLGTAAIFLTMCVAALMKFSTSGNFLDYAWPLEMAIVMLAFFFIGPGKYKIKFQA